MITGLFSRSARWRVVVVLSSLAFLLGDVRAEGPGDFTPWMSLSDLNAHLEALDGDKPGGKNFWDRGNWVTAMEGRWEKGIPEYRLRHSPVPTARRAYWWMWHFNQDQKSFDTQVHKLADEGYQLVHFNSYVRPGGSERFQGVWHKLIPITGAAALPAGRYRLVEVEGKPVSDAPVRLVIKGDRVSGNTPNREFEGSVRDRFSGSMKVTQMVETLRNDSAQEAELERSFLRLLENVMWKEEGGKLRVVKDGKTVLRLEMNEPQLEATKPAP